MIAVMPFVSRDANGAISGVFSEPAPDAQERLDIDDAELRRYLEDGDSQEPQDALAASDREMARIVEDLIELLIAKNLVNFTDFPPDAQKKMLRRRSLRRNLSKLRDLIGDDDDLIV
jgi:hypothetical protein